MSAKKLSFLVKVVSLYFPSEFDFEMHIKFSRCYIKDGQIAPQYIIEEERKLLTEGMITSIEKIAFEVYKSI